METQDEKYRALTKVIRQLTGIVAGLIILVMLLMGFIAYLNPVLFTSSGKEEKATASSSVPSAPVAPDPNEGLWKAPDVATLEGNPDKEKILYGKDLVAMTAEYFGPNGKVKKNATNGMNCQNCHLDAGTRPFGNNYGSVASTYPKYRARSGTEEDIYKRINDCFERSLNGEPLRKDSKEMEAMAAYINWLGKDVPRGEKAAGSGLKDLAYLDRAADPQKGKLAYEAKCQSCHMANGEGQLNPEKTAYSFPPLWGPNSYNDGAGLYRISNFAKYIKYNMPLGATHSNSMLSDEEAWDIAAFVNSQPRPKKDISKDWPKIEEKPVDHPFGPFADGFDEKQHKYGPFKPIVDARKK